MNEQRLYALRGATQCRNDPADLEAQIAALYDELLAQNHLEERNIVSLIFSVTADLTALNPASALRRSGRGSDLALFSVLEPPVQGALDHVVRVLVHAYLDTGRSPHHVYRNGAQVLRPDRAGDGEQKKKS